MGQNLSVLPAQVCGISERLLLYSLNMQQLCEDLLPPLF